MRDAAARPEPAISRMRPNIASVGRFGANLRFGLPTASRMRSCSSSTSCTLLWPNMSASMRSSSVISSAPPSTITMASLLAATMISRSLFAISSKVGLAMSLPSMRPTRTPAMGPAQGMSLMCSAVLAPMRARTSAGYTLSKLSTVAMICVSHLKPSGNSGRHGRSMRRETSTSSSRSRPSRLKKPPGMRPAAKVFSM